MLAPMVRSGTCTFGFKSEHSGKTDSRFSTVPTRLMALKHGATLVWSPEVVDKAILHAERVVDRESS